MTAQILDTTSEYYFQPLLEEAGLLPLRRSLTFDEWKAGSLNDLWYNIARGGRDFVEKHTPALGYVAIQLRSEGLQTGIQLANAFEGVTSPSAYYPVQPYKAPAAGMVGTCPDAESYFSMIGKGSSASEMDMGGFVVLQHDDKPVLVEKNGRGVSRSALSLQEIVVDGVPYPPGFIFGVTHRETTEVQAATTANGHMVLAAAASDVRHLQPRRLSSFGIPVDERSLVASDLTQMQAKPELADWTVDSYRDAVGIPEIQSDSYLVSSEALWSWDRKTITPILKHAAAAIAAHRAEGL